MGIIESLSTIIVALRIPLSTISGILFIFTSILLMFPKSILLKLSLFSFITNHKETISLIWLLSISILAFYVISFLFDILGAIISKKNRVKLLHSLTDMQKRIILKAYANGGEIRLPFDNAQANLLRSAHILECPSSSFVISTDNFAINYYLQPWVIEYLKNHEDF